MKSKRPVILLFIGLAAGFALGVALSGQYNSKTSITPGWQTTLSPNTMSVQLLLFGLAILALGMSLGKFIGILKNYFTTDRLEILNIGIAVIGIVACLRIAGNLFEALYLQILPEQLAYFSRTNTLFPLVILAVGTVSTQLLWVMKIRRNTSWTLIISALIILGAVT